jgi:hypothetical protein
LEKVVKVFITVMRFFRKLLGEKGSVVSTTFVSFETPLTQLCRRFPLQTALEFGPGYSTGILLRHSSAKIISIEPRFLWYMRWKNRFDSSRLTLHYRQPNEALNEMSGNQRFSLVFIDAGDRVSIMKNVIDLVHSNGIVFLHDAHREEYEPGIRLYPYRYFPERHSCILFKSKVICDAVKRLIPPDYSCNCTYCSSEDRRAYFSRLSERATRGS